MEASFFIVVISCLVGVSVSTVHIPHGCTPFGIVLNGFHGHHLPFNLATKTPSALLFGRRFILSHPLNFSGIHIQPLNFSGLNFSGLNFSGFHYDPSKLFNYSRHIVLDSIKPTLPASKEIVHTCRIKLSTTDKGQLDFVRAMMTKYKVCTICDKFDTNSTTCDTVGFCPIGSVCYRGESDDRKYWPKSSVYNIYDAAHPKAGYHGCCSLTDRKCRYHRYVVMNKNSNKLKAANYTIHTCSTPACNGGDRTKISSFLGHLNDGHWASWGSWGKCSHTCGRGTKSRVRTCTNPKPTKTGKPCVGSSTSTTHCYGPVCAVDGHWASWTSWGHCSVTCGSGTKTRTRTCTHPAPSGGGKSCGGSASSNTTCGLTACPVDGHWTSWASWGHCSVTCGDGTKTRTRKCTHPAPSGGGKSCVGSSSKSTTCRLSTCPVDGHWSTWGHWGQCSATCDGGTKTRQRTCSHPAPSHGGKTCSGSSHSSINCGTNHCPVDGHWHPWQHWGACTVTCGQGTKTRLRTCSSVLYGGQPCTGTSKSSISCGTPCRVDGHWGAWTSWGKCSVTCGHGKEARSRTCSNPAPAHGGKTCIGDHSDARQCGQPCQVDGHWSAWTSWGKCSVTCGHGKEARSRTCSNPAPAYGGKTCVGEHSNSRQCGQPCPVDGHWTAWTSWGACSVTCGDGKETRTRACTNPAPAYGGKQCVGGASDARHCGKPCIVNGHWSKWQEWSTCSKSCASGTRSRTRTCNNPAPANGGTDCSGHKTVTETCNTDRCPEWSRWFYDACSVTCGNGTTMRLRHCSSGKDSDCGVGKAFENVACNEKPCPINGAWSKWNAWSTCTATCGEGMHARSRSCDNPSPQYGGADCTGSSNENVACNTNECPHWLPFEEASSCSVTCGKGFKQMKRTCSTGVQSDCPGSAFTEETCVLEECV